MHKSAQWLVLAGALVACRSAAPGPAVSSVPVTSAVVAVAKGAGPYAPAGQDFSIQLLTPISTATTTAGQAFFAQTVTPLRDTDGSVLVPVGALVVGHVSTVAFGGAAPRLRLAFDAIETTQGPAPLDATITHADAETVGSRTPIRMPGDPLTYVQPTEQLVMMRGAQIDLRVARPIVPGAPVRPRD